MKRLKALVKMEIKPAVLVGFYFLAVNILAILTSGRYIATSWRRFLLNGIEGFTGDSAVSMISQAFTEGIIYVMLFSMIGMLLMVYVSFRNDKSIEVGRFLKGLPYTMRERCLTKVGVGISVFTVTYVLFGIGMMFLHKHSIDQFQEIYKVTVYSEVYEALYPISELLKTLLLGYIACVAIYLFAVMFQYLISSNMGSIVVAGLIYVSPFFILTSLDLYMGDAFRSSLYNVIYWLQELAFITGYERWGDITVSMNTASAVAVHHTGAIAYISLLGYKVAFYGVIAIGSLIGILVFSQKDRMEQSDVFIPSKGFRNIFIAGVTVCGGLLMGDIYYLYSTAASMIMAYVVLILGGVFSFIIAKKIACIGIKKRKGVQA